MTMLGDAAGERGALKQSMVDGGLWAAMGRIVAVAGGFLLNLALARALSPADYGTYFVVLSTMIILATVGTLGMDKVAVRLVSLHRAHAEWGKVGRIVTRCLVTVLVATLLLCAAFYQLVPWLFGSVLRMPAAIPLAATMVCWLLVSTLQRQLAESFRGLNDIRRATLFGGFRNNGILISLTTCGGALALWAAGALTLSTAFALTVGASTVVAGLAAWRLWRLLRSRSSGSERSRAGGAVSYLAILHEGWPLLAAGLIAVLRAESNGWFAAAYDSAAQVALFAIAQRFVMLVTTPLTVVNALLPPVVAELHARGEMARLQRVVQAVGGLASLPCLGVLLVIVLAGRMLLGGLFGAHYEQAYPMLIVLCLGQIANVVTGSWQVVLPMTGHRRQLLQVSAAAAAVQVLGSVVGGMLTGALGVAIGASIGMVVGNIMGVVVVRRQLGIWTLISIRRAVIGEAITLFRSRLGRLVPTGLRGR